MAEILKAKGETPRVRQVRPLRNKVLVLPLEPRDTSEGGVIIPESVKRPQLVGRVLAVGPEVPQEGPGAIKEGDYVVYAQFAGVEIVLEGDDGEPLTLLAMSVDNIIGVAEVK